MSDSPGFARRNPPRLKVSASRGGVSLLEILVATAILSMGILPVFRLMSQSRRVLHRSVLEMKAMSLATSLLDVLHRAPGEALARFPSREIEEQTLADYGVIVPASDSTLLRTVQVALVNNPSLPRERFANPWGKAVQMTVRVTSLAPGNPYTGRIIVTLRDVRHLEF
jgi:type II secretory pathway component PulJ